MAKSDIVVFRHPGGKLLVRPSVFIVDQEGDGKVRIRNQADSQILVVVPFDDGHQVLSIDTGDKGNIEAKGKKQNKRSLAHYHVFMGGEEAEGESAPALIIDD